MLLVIELSLAMPDCCLLGLQQETIFIGLLHLITSIPPRLRPFTTSTLKNATKLHSPLKTSIKYGSASKKYGFTPEEFRERVIFSLFTLADFGKN